MIMCYQLVERYSACHCLYYQHAVDVCASFSQSDHPITQRTILVGYACQNHDQTSQKYGIDSIPVDEEVLDLHPRRKSSHVGIRVLPDRRETVRGSTSAIYGNNKQGNSSTIDSQKSHPSSPKTQRSKNNLESKAYVGYTDTSQVDGDFIAPSVSDDDLSSVEAFLFGDNDDSSLTSLSSVESSTALERLTDSFLYDEYLHDLWPQIFLRTPSLEEAKEEISLLILRYSLDLKNLGRNQSTSEDTTNLKIRASIFVKQKRRYLAQEIYKQFWLPFRTISQQTAESSAFEKDLDEESDSDDDQQPNVDRFLSLNEFMFETEPFQYFRENVRMFVEKASPSSLQITWFDYMRLFFDNCMVSTYSKETHEKTKRLFWTCNCGLRLYDDYTEIQAGALDRLEKMLSKYGIQSRSSGDLESNNPKPSNNNSSSNARPSTSRSKCFDIRLPRHWQRKDNVEPGKCSRMLQTNPDEKHNYLMACLPFGRWVSRLHQPEICTINSDQDFFSLLRTLYGTNRCRLSLSWVRRVKGIHFVQVRLCNLC